MLANSKSALSVALVLATASSAKQTVRHQTATSGSSLDGKIGIH
jgi:hypothetical protein